MNNNIAGPIAICVVDKTVGELLRLADSVRHLDPALPIKIKFEPPQGPDTYTRR